MRMNFKIGQKLNLIVIVLLVVSCVVITLINNLMARQSLEKQLFEVQMPATVGNIIGVVDKKLLEPTAGLAIVANDPFFLDWIKQGEPEEEYAQAYGLLATVANHYKTYGCSFVSWGTKIYHEYSGGEQKRRTVGGDKDSWFPAFKQSGQTLGINVYVNHKDFGSIAFINRRIEDHGEFLGLTSIAIGLDEFVNTITGMTIGQHGSTFMVDSKGVIRLHADKALINSENLNTQPGYTGHLVNIFNKGESRFSYDTGDDTVSVMTKYIPELDWYLVTEASHAELFSDMNSALMTTVLSSLLLLALGVGVGFVFVRGITRALSQSVLFAKAVAEGDLDRQLAVRRTDEIGDLSDALRIMVTTLKEKIREVSHKTEEAEEKALAAEKATAEAQEAKALAERAKSQGMLDAARRLEDFVEEVRRTSEAISRQSDEIHRGTDIQSERVHSTATAMEEMNATVLEVARNSSQAAEVGKDAQQKASEGMHVVQQAVEAMEATRSRTEQLRESMNRLGTEVESIGSVMNVINDIADQTNLLALNAAIEAARAGEAGRGFAVVADEVRKLAEKTMQATTEVGTVVTTIQNASKENMAAMGVAMKDLARVAELTQESGSALKAIETQVEASASQIQSIATAAEEQSATSEEINRSVEEINSITEDTARGAADTASAVAELANQINGLSHLIQEMKDEARGSE
ncbi:methyl-accepting chemotaxis protein [Salidesulfovibrio onnuriiensis]|uniref:methyl-accepting chemotaxis protein n=1 Tax=Salidesulfovibrio onnuriiensis TaxID=2583823 RepID=UPI0011CA6EAB|nr:methyl-accepting chemotaxis protein [Salidesulfovibrio onnuriiensis]